VVLDTVGPDLPGVNRGELSSRVSNLDCSARRSSAGDGFDGQMLVFDPPEVMEFTWGTDRLRIELRADGAGTLLTLTDTFDELGKAARGGAGWHECLDRLVAGLDGAPQRPMGELWVEIHPRYVTQLGPAAATIGPPPGHDPRRAGSR
jgi:hypothetical protein